MGDAGEGLIDAELRIQERMEELEAERRAVKLKAPVKDPVRVRELESCRLARIEMQRQLDNTVHALRKEQLVQAVEELDRRMTELSK
jgi:hypothetical protein